MEPMINRTMLAALANKSELSEAEMHEQVKTAVLYILDRCEEEAHKGKYSLQLFDVPNWKTVDTVRCASLLCKEHGLTAGTGINSITLHWNV